jgi:hypothetical protein
MLPIRTSCFGFAAAATSMALLTGISLAEDAVDARAEWVCAQIAQTGTPFHGALKVDDLTIRRDENGTVTLARRGVKLGEIAQSSYVDHTVCLVEVIALISPKA